jgi:hypothetical protein
MANELGTLSSAALIPGEAVSMNAGQASASQYLWGHTGSPRLKNVWTDMPGCSAVPVAGTYQVFAHFDAAWSDDSGDKKTCIIQGRIMKGASQQGPVAAFTGLLLSATRQTISTSAIFTVGGSDTVKLQVLGLLTDFSSPTNPTAYVSTATRLVYWRIA